jgi:nitroimidazol reductase NimA-like FMN-containing flavoprotein (pyridoxamine 5'-phosphate oxidase superfamily)
MSEGAIRRQDRVMSRANIEALLERARLAHFATVGADGEPYVVPNLFVYAEGCVFLHTALAGHFRRNIEHRPRLSMALTEPGEVYPYGEFACDTSTSYASVVAVGAVAIESDAAATSRFFDRFLGKYADARWDRPTSFYPRLDQVTVYRVALERVTGKRSELPAKAEQWPAQNRTKSPGAIPPAKREQR